MHVLLIDDKVPDPHFGAGFPRAYRLLISLIQLGHKITFFPTLKANLEVINRDLLRTYGVEVCDDLQKLYRDVDVAIISRPHNMHYYMPVVKETQPQAKIIYDTEALWYRRYDLQLKVTGKLPGWAYRYDELGLARAVDLCWVVNHEEKKILEDNGVKKVKVLAHALNIHEAGKTFENRNDFLVVGGILEEDSSNEDALWYYLDSAWEQVRIGSGAVINITGKATSPRLVNHKFNGVNLMGHVDNLVPLYESHRVFVASTRFATGIPWKVHEAMANGIPCVISKLLADQLRVKPGKEALVANTPKEFITKSIKLYTDSNLWSRVREDAFELVKRDCDPVNFKGIIQATLSELVS